MLRTNNASLKLAWFGAEYPFHATSILQSLFLLPQGIMPPLSSLIPFTIGPPLSLSLVSFSWSGFLHGARNFVLHPFVLAYFQEICGPHLFTCIYILLRRIILKPDRADQISLQYSHHSDELLDEANASLISANKMKQQDHGPQTLAESLRVFFPAIFQLWDRILQTRRAPLPVDLTEDIEAELMNRSAYYYQELLRENRGLSPEQRRPRQMLRLQAIRSAFGDYSLDPEHDLLDSGWVDDVVGLYSNSNASTSTPDPQDLFSPEDLLEQPADEQPVNAEARDATEHVQIADHHINPDEREVTTDNLASIAVVEATESSSIPIPSAFEPTIPLETLLEERPADTQGSPELRALTPVPGISRAPSLPQVTPRPVRRPTDLGEDPRPIREELIRHQAPPRVLRNSDDSQYRVTTLSNHPADTLALSLASLITSILMLPLEMMLLRSLTRNFLISRLNDTGSAGRDPSLADIWPLSPRMGLKDLGVLRSVGFWGNWFLSLGIQGVFSLITWTASTHITLRLGRRFGWGKF
jgi:hypothetical protein